MTWLTKLLDLEPRGDDRFTAWTPSDGPDRLFGGQVASQTLRAATLTVDQDRRPNSLHAYFVRPGKPGVPLDLSVVRVRDGRSFSTRQVTAAQDGDTVFVMLASFHGAEPGFDWQLPAPADVPGPEGLDDVDTPLRRFKAMDAVDIVLTHRRRTFPLHPFWVKTHDRLPDDPAVHACAITFLSDIAVVGGARSPEATDEAFSGASLDHAVWFHRPARADEWLLFSATPTTNHGARGLAAGTLHTTDGTLVASIHQEALLRPTATVPLP